MNNHTYLNSEEDLSIDEYGQMWMHEGDTLRHAPDLRGKSCHICNEFWKHTGAAFLDHVLLYDKIHCHRSCHQRVVELDELHNYAATLSKLNIFWDNFEFVANPYSNEWPRRTMFTLKHPWRLSLMLGIRKRVDEVRFYNMPVAAFHAHISDLKEWPHTQGTGKDEHGHYTYIHAWKAEEIEEALCKWRELIAYLEPAHLSRVDERQEHPVTFSGIDAARAEQKARWAAQEAEREAKLSAGAIAAVKEMDQAITKG